MMAPTPKSSAAAPHSPLLNHLLAALPAEGALALERDRQRELIAGDSFAEGQTVISSTARNFKGRMGPPSTQVYLGSAYTVAASALRGRITDPREVLT